MLHTACRADNVLTNLRYIPIMTRAGTAFHCFCWFLRRHKCTGREKEKKAEYRVEKCFRQNACSITSSQNVIKDDVTRMMPGMKTVVK